VFRKREGRADAGVSTFMGTGRAKGFGGPVAPAERSAEVEGEGGGRIILEFRRGA
jgi:hypothetical protein